MKIYLVLIFLIFTFFCFSQINSKELSSKSLGYNNYPYKVELNNNTILKFNNEGYLIEKKETNGIDFFIIENLFDGELLTCSKTYMNNKIITIENYDYNSNLVLSNYQKISNNDTIEIVYLYNEKSKLVKEIETKSNDDDEIITEYYNEGNKDSIVSKINNIFFKIITIEKSDTLNITSDFESDTNFPDNVVKTYYNDKKIVKEEIYTFNILIDKTLYFDENKFNSFKTLNIEKDVGTVFILDKRRNWIKKIKNNIVVEERKINYDIFLNIIKIEHYKMGYLFEKLKYKYTY